MTDYLAYILAFFASDPAQIETEPAKSAAAVAAAYASLAPESPRAEPVVEESVEIKQLVEPGGPAVQLPQKKVNCKDGKCRLQ